MARPLSVTIAVDCRTHMVQLGHGLGVSVTLVSGPSLNRGPGTHVSMQVSWAEFILGRWAMHFPATGSPCADLCTCLSSSAAPQKAGQPLTAESTPSGLGAAPWEGEPFPGPRVDKEAGAFRLHAFVPFELRVCVCVCARAHKLPIQKSHHRCSATLFHALFHVLGRRRGPPSIVLTRRNSQ